MDQVKVDRINVLARKSKAEGLTEAEKAEQQVLRKEYIANWKSGMRSTLESVRIVEDDGTHTALKKNND